MLADVLQDLMKPEIMWFLGGLVLVFLEFLLPGLVVIFFGAGAIITSVACMIFDLELNAQILVFTISSVLTLVLLRKALKTMFMGSSTGSAGDESVSNAEFVGCEATVVEAFGVNKNGRVELNGTEWKAVCDQSLAVGETVVVTGQRNLTLEVKPR